MFFYLLLFFFVCIFYKAERVVPLTVNNITTIANYTNPIWILFLLCAVSGFRYNLGGSDYEYYEYYYDRILDIDNYLVALASSEYEVGYTTFIYICAHILHLSFNGYLVLEAIIVYSLMYVGLRRYIPSWGIFLLLFLYKMFFYVTFVAMRQAITVAGFYCVMRYLEERKLIKYYASILFVGLFHYGALLLFLLYPFRLFTYTKRRLIMLGVIFGLLLPFAGLTSTIISFGISILGLNSLEDKAAGYTGGDFLNILYTVEYYLILWGVVKYFDKIIKFKHAEFVIYLFVMVLPIVTILRSSSIFVRELFYFYPSYAILLYYIFTNARQKTPLLKCFFVLLCLAGVIKYLIQFGDGCLMPYDTWLFNSNIHIFQL